MFYQSHFVFYQPHGSDPNFSWLKMRLDGSETQAARLRRWSHGGTQSHASSSVAFVQLHTSGPTDRVKNSPTRDNSGKRTASVQPLSSQRLKSHLEMKVSVAGWNEWAPRDHQAARRGAVADFKYMIRQGAGKGCGTEICFGIFLSGFCSCSSGPKRFHLREFVPAWSLEHVGSTGMCYSNAQRCCRC